VVLFCLSGSFSPSPIFELVYATHITPDISYSKSSMIMIHGVSGEAGEGASEGTRPGAQALGAHQHTFCSHFKTRFKQKFRPKYA